VEAEGIIVAKLAHSLDAMRAAAVNSLKHYND
jgi:hypothetical protein